MPKLTRIEELANNLLDECAYVAASEGHGGEDVIAEARDNAIRTIRAISRQSIKDVQADSKRVLAALKSRRSLESGE